MSACSTGGRQLISSWDSKESDSVIIKKGETGVFMIPSSAYDVRVFWTGDKAMYEFGHALTKGGRFPHQASFFEYFIPSQSSIALPSSNIYLKFDGNKDRLNAYCSEVDTEEKTMQGRCLPDRLTVDQVPSHILGLLNDLSGIPKFSN